MQNQKLMNRTEFYEYLVNPGENIEVRMNSLSDNDLHHYYNLLTHQRPDGRWSRQNLLKYVMNSIYEKIDELTEISNKKVKMEEKRNEMLKKIEERGSLEQFIAKPFDHPEIFEGDQKLRYFMLDVLAIMKNYEDVHFPKYVESLKVSDIISTLSWSTNFVRESVRYEVAKEIIDMFDSGATYNQIFERLTYKLTTCASTIQCRSTSQMKNLIDDHKISIIAGIIDRRNFL